MNFINKLLNLSSNIKIFLNNLNNKLKYSKKTNIINGFLFKLLYTMNNSTQIDTTVTLNIFNNTNISRISYINRVKNIDISVFNDIYNYLNKQINLHFHDSINNDNDYTIFAVDGTYLQLKESLSCECKKKKNNNSVTCLSTGIFNLTYNEPSILKLENKITNERTSLYNYIIYLININKIIKKFIFLIEVM